MKIELYHDILAQRIFQMASGEEQMRLKVEQFIRSRYQFFQEQGVMLQEEDLEYVQPYLDACLLTSEELKFVRDSREVLQRRQRWRWILVAGVITVLLLSLISTSTMWYQREQVYKQQERVNYALKAVRALEQGKPSLAFRLAERSVEEGMDYYTRDIIEPIFKELLESGLKCDLFHPDSVTIFDLTDSIVATADRTGVIRFWNDNCEQLNFTYRHEAKVNVMHFAEDGRTFISGDAAGNLFLVDLERRLIDTIINKTSVEVLAFARNRQPFFLIGDALGVVSVFRFGKYVPEYQLKLSSPSVTAEFAEDNTFLMVVTRDSVLVRESPFELDQPTITQGIDHHIQSAHIIAGLYDKQKVFISTRDSWYLYSSSLQPDQASPLYYSLEHLLESDSVIQSVHLSEQRSSISRMVVISADSSAVNWRFSMGLNYKIFARKQPLHAAFSYQNRYLLLSLEGGVLDLWDNYTQKAIREIKCRAIKSNFFKDGNQFVTHDGGVTLHIWDWLLSEISPRLPDNIDETIDFYNPRLQPLMAE